MNTTNTQATDEETTNLLNEQPTGKYSGSGDSGHHLVYFENEST